jgi:hypothetical protein
VGGFLSFAAAQDTNIVMNIQTGAQSGRTAKVDSIARLDADASNFYVYLKNGSTLTVPRAQIQKVFFAQTAVVAVQRPVRPAERSGAIMVRRWTERSVVISMPAKMAGAAQAKVFDSQGLCVRHLTLQGRAGLAWDGRSDGGSPVPAGVYILRCTAGNQVVFTRTIPVE